MYDSLPFWLLVKPWLKRERNYNFLDFWNISLSFIILYMLRSFLHINVLVSYTTTKMNCHMGEFSKVIHIQKVSNILNCTFEIFFVFFFNFPFNPDMTNSFYQNIIFFFPLFLISQISYSFTLRMIIFQIYSVQTV